MNAERGVADDMRNAATSAEPANGAPFVVRDYIRWGDVDPAGIIRYDAYTRFFELGEAECFRSLGIPHTVLVKRFAISLPRRLMHMEFTSPPRLDELLEVVVYISEVGATSLRMNFDIYGDSGVMRMHGYLVLVCVGLDAMRKRPFPEDFLAVVDRYRMRVEEARAFRVSSGA